MYIAPNSTVGLLHNVPLDPTYDHTIYFANETQQQQYFRHSGLIKYTFTAQSYQRVNKGSIKVALKVNDVPICADNLYDCNYMIFQNTNFGNKWFYAFIKSVEYVSNSVTEIHYEIDDIQTWMFDYTLDPCFVEREHSTTDEIGDNITPENLNLGDEYVICANDKYDMNNMYVCIMQNKKWSDGTTSSSQTINKIYTPVRIGAGIPPADSASIDYIIDRCLEDETICVYQYPAFMGDSSTTTPVVVDKTITRNDRYIDSYQPVNKKLFTYPYNFLLVSNNAGTVAEYRWEDWGGARMGTFKIAGVFVSIPSVICYPTYYRNLVDNYDDGVILSNFPQCAWSGDTFKAWWAQNKTSVTTSLITQAMQAIGGVAQSAVGATAFAGSYGFAGGDVLVRGGAQTASAMQNILGTLSKIEDIKHIPNQTFGHVQTESLNAGMNRVQFNFYSVSIKKEHAKIIDDFFSRYGYATKLSKVPNRCVRKRWTYTKTIGCTISGSIPADSAVHICNIYNNGITFWRYSLTDFPGSVGGGVYVGYYNMADNPPLT